MKFTKLSIAALSLLLVGTLAACGGNSEETSKTTENPTQTATPTENNDGIMSYSEYVATPDGEDVVIAGYVQAKQGWWDNKATVYLQDDNGGYFIYNLPCTKEQYNSDLANGNKLKISGVKGSWAGMIEILGSEPGAEATFEKLEGTKTYPAKKLTDLSSENLLSHLAQNVAIDNLTVVEVSFPKGEGDDIQYVVTDGTSLYTFYVEAYLTDKNTEVYKAVAALKVGDVINVEGFMYAYNGPQLHTTKCTKTGNALVKSEGTMTYAEYMAASDGTEVVIEGFIQAKQGWWEDKATVYLADENGAYFVYNLPCTKDQYDKELKIGNKIKVTGQKGSWEGMVEIMGSEAGAEATYELLDGRYLTLPKDVTNDLSKENLISHISQKVKINGLIVKEVKLPEAEGKDIEYIVTDGVVTYSFYVESYLTDKNTDVYKTVAALKPGDLINVEGYMYVYKGPQLHTTRCEATGTNMNKAKGSMLYSEYAAAADGTSVVIEGFIQAKQGWWEDKATIYLADQDGAYFVYNLPCTKDQYDKELKIGNRIQVTGQKGSWEGMVEILGGSEGAEATYKLLDGHYISKTKDLTAKFDDPKLVDYCTQKVSFKNLEVVSKAFPKGEGDDIELKVTNGTTTLTFYVEAYLTNKDTNVYKMVAALEAGDHVNLEGFMYIYKNPQLHITKCNKLA